MATARNVRRSPFRIVTAERYDPEQNVMVEERYKIKSISMMDVLAHPMLEVSNLRATELVKEKLEDVTDIPDGLYDDQSAFTEASEEVEAEMSVQDRAERGAEILEATLRLGMVRPRIASDEELEAALRSAAEEEELVFEDLDEDDLADLDPMPFLSDRLVTMEYIKSCAVKLFSEIQKLSGLDVQSERLVRRFRGDSKRSSGAEDSESVSGSGGAERLPAEPQSS